MTAVQRYLRRDGEIIGYQVHGHGPPVVLCHGLLGDGRLWDGVKAALSDYQLIIPDLRGHRHSTASRAFSMWDIAGDLVAIADAMELESPALVGFSMGGMAAMRAVMQAPSRFGKLGLISTGARAEPMVPKLLRLGMKAVVSSVGPLRILEPEMKRIMFAPDFRKRRADVVKTEMHRIRERPGKPLGRAIGAVFLRDSVVGKLDLVRQSTLIVVGERDRITPAHWSDELAANLSNCRLVKLPGVGHMTPLETPERVGQGLASFLSEC